MGTLRSDERVSSKKKYYCVVALLARGRRLLVWVLLSMPPPAGLNFNKKKTGTCARANSPSIKKPASFRAAKQMEMRGIDPRTSRKQVSCEICRMVEAFLATPAAKLISSKC